jgi:hypothetical protein
MILSVNTLPKSLNRRIRSSRVRVNEVDGVITLTPIKESDKATATKLEQIRKRRIKAKGSMKGRIKMSADFDAPLDEMREYM